MSQYKDAALGDTVYFWFAANETDGDAGDGADPLYDVRLAGAAADAAPVLSGSPTLLSHANYSPGLFEIAVAATTGNGFAAGNEYAVFCTLTISSVNPAGFVGSFKLVAAGKNLHAITDAILTDTAEIGVAGAGLTNIGTIATVTNLTNAPTSGDFTATMKTSLNAATPAVTVSDKTGFALSAAGVQAIWDALTSALTAVGSIGKYLLDHIVGTILTGDHTAQTGDSFTRLGAPAGASVSADIAAVKAQTASIESKIDTIDGIVDSILEDTETTLAAAIAAIKAVVDAMLLDIEADSYIDTTTTPWSIVVHKKGDIATVYYKKSLKTTAAANVDSENDIIGQHIHLA